VTGLFYLPALPELFIALGAMVLLMVGVFKKERSYETVSFLSVLLLTSVLVIINLDYIPLGYAFNFSFLSDDFSNYTKSLILLASIGIIIISSGYLKSIGIVKFEYPVLILLSVVGMMVMVSSNDIVSLYLGLELQSLPLYVLASIRRESKKSTEAGLKYFVLGALSSCMLLYGLSLIYGFSGSIIYSDIANFLSENNSNKGILFGLAFLTAGLAFKISVVPFHMWAPDVYEGSPTTITAFLASAPKVAAVALFTKVMVSCFPSLIDQWQLMIIFISIASMLLGSFAAIGQNNIKRLLAYSSIGHMGFILIGLATGTLSGVTGLLIYLTIYIFMVVGAFSCVLALRTNDVNIENISDLSGLSKVNPVIAFILSMFLFSLAGIPPLAGFFAKFYIFLSAIESGLYTLAIIGVLASVVGAFYYLRIIKIIYFDENINIFEPISKRMKLIIYVTAIPVILFFIRPSLLTDLAEKAALSLF